MVKKQAKNLSTEPFESAAENPPPFLWSPDGEQIQSRNQPAATLCLSALAQPQSTGPVLDITDRQGALDGLASLRVMAVMAHPRDATARDEILVTWKAKIGSYIQAHYS